MKYRDYKLEDFLRDEKFVQWVRHQDDDSNYFWNSFIANNPAQRDVLLKAKEYILSLDTVKRTSLYGSVDKDEIFEKILSDRKSNRTQYLGENGLRIRKVYAVAASVLITLGLGIILTVFFGNYPQNGDELISENTGIITRFNPKGQSSTTRLPDGTKVKLAANSTLTYRSDFNSTHREVTLVGNAFFTVVRNPQRPFKVSAGKLTTTVLGTSFGVNMKSADNINVALTEGEVKVDALGMSVLMQPNETVKYRTTTNSLVKVKLDYLRDIAWKDGILAFDHANIYEVKQRLEDWYGVKIHLSVSDDDLILLNGKFESKSLEFVLDAMSYILEIEYELKGKEVKIWKKNEK